jgi:hypothetical protein
VKVHFLKTKNLCGKGTFNFSTFQNENAQITLYFGGGRRNIFVALPLLFIIVGFHAISYIFHHGTYLKEVKAFTNKWMGLNIESNKQERNSFVKQREL